MKLKKRYLYLLFLGACSTGPTTPDSPAVETKTPATSYDPAKVLSIVSASNCSKVYWANRGKAPVGYYKGLGLSFAKQYCSPLKNLGTTGAFTQYGVKPSLVNLFTILTGLGMRESSGKHCVGRDVTNPKPSAVGGEAGAWQTSLNAIAYMEHIKQPKAAQEMRELIAKYKADKSGCNLDAFKEGVTCSAANWANYGEGPGAEYQALAKSCPTMHLEFTALVISHAVAHHGPLKTKAAEVKSECLGMYSEIEAYLKTTNCKMP